MAVLAATTVAYLAHLRGIPNAQLATCVAIAWAESGLRTDAVGHNPPTPGCPGGSRDRGLWQINDCYHRNIIDQQAFDADGNARAMVLISSRGTNWRPWSTFNSGVYRRYLAAAQIAAAIVIGVGVLPVGYTPPPDQVERARQVIENGGAPWQGAINLVNSIFNGVAARKYGIPNAGVSISGGLIK